MKYTAVLSFLAIWLLAFSAGTSQAAPSLMHVALQCSPTPGAARAVFAWVGTENNTLQWLQVSQTAEFYDRLPMPGDFTRPALTWGPMGSHDSNVAFDLAPQTQYFVRIVHLGAAWSTSPTYVFDTGPAVQCAVAATGDRTNCDPSYPTLCLPPGTGDTLNCPDVLPARNFPVRQPDPHGFDNDRDGIGCES